MATFKCKMCGGSLEITEGKTVCTCEYCGTEQTLPRLDSDKKANLYDRANHFRRNNDYDKAMSIYEQILNEDGTDAEAYWSLVLCKYGIEYVEDPATHKRIPTVNRAQFTSIFDDENYKEALANADTLQKAIYEEEAKTINDIQKGILAISSKEEPFDVFICYKETDENGRRTPDSVLANDLYHQLTQEGFKVFFARITLEDKLGQEYEPYIFAALNSSKAMVVLGTKPEYFNAVWVKNEWSRYLALIKNGEKKILIPAYKDMDPYDLPEEFSHLQAQDMGKLGFMQDLIRGIKKILGADEKNKETVVIQQSNTSSNVSTLLKRGNIALEDGDWKKADEFFEEVLNQDAECAEAYLGKLMAKSMSNSIQELTGRFVSKYKTAKKEQSEACPEESKVIEESVSNYTVEDYLSEKEIRKQYAFDRTYMSELSSRKQQKEQQMSELSNERLLVRVKQYATGETKTDIDNMLEEIENALDKRIADAQNADNESIALVKSNYKKALSDADVKVQELYRKALERQENVYKLNVSQMNQAKTIFDYEKVYKYFKKMNGYKDVDELANQCLREVDRIREKDRVEREQQKIARQNKEKEEDRKRKKIAVIVTVVIIACIAMIIVAKKVKVAKQNNNKYSKAVELMNNGEYEEACKQFQKLDGYKDSNDKIDIINNECIPNEKYNKAVELMNSGNYDEARKQFEELRDYKDSNELIIECIKGKYKHDEVGDIIEFGNYNGNNEWEILDKEDDKILVVSKYAIENKSYNDGYVDITWEKCTLRSWLNNEYLNSAFDSAEQSLIMNTKVTNADNKEYGNPGGNDTTDKIFLLSIDEANKYFTSNNERKATLPSGTSCCWWLRSPGSTRVSAARVYTNGYITDKYANDYFDTAVRPAMWINLEP